MTPPAAASWQRTDRAAFVDDGQRILVLRLGEPEAARPLLLEGATASVWRVLRAPCTSLELADQLISHLPAGPSATVEQVEGFLDVLRAASLVEASHT